MNIGMVAACLLGAILSICAMVAVSISWMGMLVFFALLVDSIVFLTMAVWFLMS